MSKIILLWITLCILAVYSNDARGKILYKTKAEKKFVERLNGVAKKAREIVGEMKSSGAVRNVGRGKTPKIICRNGQIYFNNNLLHLRDSLHYWMEIIPGTPRCYHVGLHLCVWDDLGLEVGTDSEASQEVTFFSIYFKFSDFEKDPSNFIFNENGKERKIENWMPRSLFPGYLELDGYGLDAETKFWEVRAGTNGVNKLHCGLRDCNHPSGAFGENSRIDLILDGSHESSTLRKFSVSVTIAEK